MAFDVKEWKNRDEGAPTTPINAASLEDLETRVTDYAAPAQDEINFRYPFNTASGIGSSLSGGGYSGSLMPHNNASSYPWITAQLVFPEHWQTALVDLFWFTATSGLTGGPTLQIAKTEQDPEGGGLVSASFSASANVAVPSASLTQYQIYKTTLDANLVVDPTKLTTLRALRVSLNASQDGLAGSIGAIILRLRRAT